MLLLPRCWFRSIWSSFACRTTWHKPEGFVPAHIRTHKSGSTVQWGESKDESGASYILDVALLLCRQIAIIGWSQKKLRSSGQILGWNNRWVIIQTYFMMFPLCSYWRPSFSQPSHRHCDGGSAGSGQDVHIQKTHPLPQLDRHTHQR